MMNINSSTMRLLLCSPFNSEYSDNPGGIIVWTRNILEYYRAIGSGSEIELELYDLDRSIYVHKSLGFFSRLCCGIKDYIHHCVCIYKLLAQKQFNAIHLCSSASLSLFKDLVIVRLAKFWDVSVVIHFHFGRIPDLKLKGNWEWILLKKVIRLSTKVIVMDDRSYNSLKDFSTPVFNIPNPLSLEVQEYIDGLEPTERIEREILFVGHVERSKGIFDLVQACKSIDNIHLKIIGKVLDKDREAIITLAGSDKWIEFLGTISHKDVLSEMAKCGVFVLPSYTEGFPNVIIESMYSCCPIVATDVGAIPQMLNVMNGSDCGICVSPGSIEQLRIAINYMLDNRIYANECGFNARKRVLEQFSIASVWNSLNEIWQE